MSHPNTNVSTELSQATVRALFLDREGRLWIGASSGLYCLSPASQTFGCGLNSAATTPYSAIQNVEAIYEDTQGDLWFGGFDGLYDFNPADGSLQHYTYNPSNPSSLSEDQVTVIAPGDGATLWIGTWAAV